MQFNRENKLNWVRNKLYVSKNLGSLPSSLGAGKVGEKEINKPFIAAAASSRFPIQRAIGLRTRDHQKPPPSTLALLKFVNLDDAPSANSDWFR